MSECQLFSFQSASLTDLSIYINILSPLYNIFNPVKSLPKTLSQLGYCYTIINYITPRHIFHLFLSFGLAIYLTKFQIKYYYFVCVLIIFLLNLAPEVHPSLYLRPLLVPQHPIMQLIQEVLSDFLSDFQLTHHLLLVGLLQALNPRAKVE